jgi:hypothetical protein
MKHYKLLIFTRKTVLFINFPKVCNLLIEDKRPNLISEEQDKNSASSCHTYPLRRAPGESVFPRK